MNRVGHLADAVAMQSSMLQRGLSFRTLMLGVLVGGSAGLPLYLWQGDAPTAIACMIVVGYTIWLWAATAEAAADYRHLCSELRELPFNCWWRRLGRMLGDWGFWWSTMFGCATITGSAWYVGLQDWMILAAIGVGWAAVAVALNYGLTLLHPTTRCRRCFYQLSAHLDPDDVHQRVICPECGAKWNKIELGLAAPQRRRARTTKNNASKRRTRAAATAATPQAAPAARPAPRQTAQPWTALKTARNGPTPSTIGYQPQDRPDKPTARPTTTR